MIIMRLCIHAVKKGEGSWPILSEDYHAFYRGLDTMLEVMEVLENARKQAGILYLGD